MFSRPTKPMSAKTGGVRPALFYGSFTALLATNVLTLVGFLMAPDIANLLNGQNETVFAAYEDRIAQLRIEVDRLHSRQYAQAGDINLQLQELTQQQEVLLEQHQYVKQLAEKASELGLDTAVAATEAAAHADEEEPLVTSALSYVPGTPASNEIETAAGALRDMMDETRLALVAISDAANSSTDEILAELADIGIRPDLPETEAVGGPFIPATEGADALSIVDDANSVVAALARFKAAKGAIDVAPIHRPIDGSIRMSSSYGNRKDPFTRKKAFHAGADFPAPTGTTVLAAGDGEVIFAGEKSSYGIVVEVKHENGLITRYAHLSAFLVKEGQLVSTGSPIARVGSTGRSTGPHLHFEIRRKDEPRDPARYLNAGKSLMRFLAA